MAVRSIMGGAVLALLGSAALAASPAPESSAASRGLALAQRNCAGCHAIGGGGTSPNAKAPTFRSLHMRYPAETLDEAFRGGLLYRHPAMPQFRLLPSEVADLTAYFHALRERRPGQAASGTLVRIAQPGG